MLTRNDLSFQYSHVFQKQLSYCCHRKHNIEASFRLRFILMHSKIKRSVRGQFDWNCRSINHFPYGWDKFIKFLLTQIYNVNIEKFVVIRFSNTYCSLSFLFVIFMVLLKEIYSGDDGKSMHVLSHKMNKNRISCDCFFFLSQYCARKPSFN